MSDIQVVLGDELLTQAGISEIRPEGTADESIKFDAKGSLHVMCRDADGKLLKDIPIKETATSNTQIDMEEYYERLDQLERAREGKRQGVLIVYLVSVFLAAMFTGAVVILLRLLGGL